MLIATFQMLVLRDARGRLRVNESGSTCIPGNRAFTSQSGDMSPVGLAQLGEGVFVWCQRW